MTNAPRLAPSSPLPAAVDPERVAAEMASRRVVALTVAIGRASHCAAHDWSAVPLAPETDTQWRARRRLNGLRAARYRAEDVADLRWSVVPPPPLSPEGQAYVDAHCGAVARAGGVA